MVGWSVFMVGVVFGLVIGSLLIFCLNTSLVVLYHHHHQNQQDVLYRRDEKLEEMQKEMKDMQRQMNRTTDAMSQLLQLATGKVHFAPLFHIMLTSS
jgi:uncharacterized membrane-anchored protein YhcB (DUF1043 family)